MDDQLAIASTILQSHILFSNTLWIVRDVNTRVWLRVSNVTFDTYHPMMKNQEWSFDAPIDLITNLHKKEEAKEALEHLQLWKNKLLEWGNCVRGIVRGLFVPQPCMKRPEALFGPRNFRKFCMGKWGLSQSYITPNSLLSFSLKSSQILKEAQATCSSRISNNIQCSSSWGFKMVQKTKFPWVACLHVLRCSKRKGKREKMQKPKKMFKILPLSQDSQKTKL